jgi:hypothetical protein
MSVGEWSVICSNAKGLEGSMPRDELRELWRPKRRVGAVNRGCQAVWVCWACCPVLLKRQGCGHQALAVWLARIDRLRCTKRVSSNRRKRAKLSAWWKLVRESRERPKISLTYRAGGRRQAVCLWEQQAPERQISDEGVRSVRGCWRVGMGVGVGVGVVRVVV